MLNCCYSRDSGIVLETFLMLQGLVQYLTWQRSSSFLVQLSFMLRPFFEEVGSSAAPPAAPARRLGGPSALAVMRSLGAAGSRPLD